MILWMEVFRPVLVVLQLLGFSFGSTSAPPPKIATPKTSLDWSPEARSDFIASLSGMVVMEGVCGLTYDQAALTAFIEKNVPATDTRFFGDFGRMKRQFEGETKGMPETERTVLCLQTSRSTKAFGFLR